MATPSPASRTSSSCTSALVAMSMPRVGSSTMSSAGLAAEPFGQDDLLLVAARQHGHRVGEPAVLEPQPLGPVGGERPFGRGPDEAALPQPGQRGERHVLLDRHVHDQALLAPVLRHVADPGRHRGRGRRLAQLLCRARSPCRRRSGRCRRWPAPPRCGPSRPGPPARRSPPPAPRSEMSVNTPSRVRRSTRSTSSPGWPRSPAVRCGMSRPTMARTRSSAVRPASSLASTVLPSRITVTRWQISKTSSSRCEMNSTAAPSARSARTTSNSRATSAADSAAVGSSITMTRASSESALAISTICWSAMDSPRADPARVELHAQPLEQGRGLRPHEPAVDPPAGQQWLTPHEDVLGHREVGEQGRFLVDDGDAGRLGGGRAGEHDGLAVDEQLALIRLVHPGQHLHHASTCPPRSPRPARAPRRRRGRSSRPPPRAPRRTTSPHAPATAAGGPGSCATGVPGASGAGRAGGRAESDAAAAAEPGVAGVGAGPPGAAVAGRRLRRSGTGRGRAGRRRRWRDRAGQARQASPGHRRRNQPDPAGRSRRQRRRQQPRPRLLSAC